MASLVYNEFLLRLLSQWASGKDVRARLCMNTTTCDTETDGVANLSDFTLIDVADATGYADVALTSEATSKDDANDRGEFDAADVVFSGLSGDATRDYQGVLLYEYVDGTLANDIPMFFVDFVTDIPAAATQVTVPWDAEGIVQTSPV